MNNIDCFTVKLSWKGNKEQQYIANVMGADNNGNTLFEETGAKYSCDENGNCHAVIAVKEGAIVN